MQGQLSPPPGRPESSLHAPDPFHVPWEPLHALTPLQVPDIPSEYPKTPLRLTPLQTPEIPSMWPRPPSTWIYLCCDTSSKHPETPSTP